MWLRDLQGEICDIDGNCVDAAEDEMFKLTTKGGKMSVEREKVKQMHTHAYIGISTPGIHNCCQSVMPRATLGTS